MHAHTILRAVGVAGVVAAYGLFVAFGTSRPALIIAVLGVIAIVAPEVLDQLPFGPGK